MKKLLLSLTVATVLTACGDENVDPMQEVALPEPTTESGFYENSATTIGQKFLEEITDTVLFAYNSEDLTETAKSILTKQAEFIKANKISKIVVEGHADERGTREYNLALGEKRANKVKRFLISQGVLPNYIQVISYGKERPLVDASSPNAWSKNRRGVTIVM